MNSHLLPAVFAAPLIAQDLQMWARNIWYGIGLLIFGSFCLLIVLILYVALRMFIFQARQRHSMAEYYRRTRRADGKMYPPSAVGICEGCQGIRKKVYHLASGERLCPECYEPFWRAAEGWAGQPPPKPESPPLLPRLRTEVRRAFRLRPLEDSAPTESEARDRSTTDN